jgi:hypothetical protein
VRRAQGHYAESVKLYRAALPVLEQTLGRESASVQGISEGYQRTLREASRVVVIR